jgi:hypothetical protein
MRSIGRRGEDFCRKVGMMWMRARESIASASKAQKSLSEAKYRGKHSI